jgi:hypothetical protein
MVGDGRDCAKLSDEILRWVVVVMKAFSRLYNVDEADEELCHQLAQ